MLHTMFEVQSIHLQAALWSVTMTFPSKVQPAGASTCRLHFGWECHCHRSKRYPPFESGLPLPSFWEWPPPSPRNNWGPRCTFFPFFIVFVKDSIPGNWLQKRVPEARGKSSPKRERRRRKILPEAQEIPRSGETNSQFLALNFCKAHTSSISCSYLVCDTDYLLLCVGKFFFHLTRTSLFFFSSHVGQVFFSLLCVGQVVFFYLWVGQVFFFTKTSCSPPWSLMVRPLGRSLLGNFCIWGKFLEFEWKFLPFVH